MRQSGKQWASEAGWRGAAALSPDELLLAPTPPEWFDAAATQLPLLLVDHANCEKKAASTALSLMFTYADDFELAARMSRLAREELRHFEQVLKQLGNLHLAWRRLRPSRYAEGLRAAVASAEPLRQLDLLACGALIEARSCERFEGLVPRLPAALAAFYGGLAASESRHFSLYLELARRRAGAAGADLDARLLRLAEIEAGLATRPDPELRFHSGRPVSVAGG